MTSKSDVMRVESASAPVRAGRTGRHVCTSSLLWWLFLLTSSSNHPLPPGLVPASFALGLPASDRDPATNVTSQHSDGDASKREVQQRSKSRRVWRSENKEAKQQSGCVVMKSEKL